MLRNVPSISTFWGVVTINGWISSKAFSASIEMIIRFYSSICWYDVSQWLICRCWRILASLGRIPGIHHLIMMYDLFNVLLDTDCKYFVDDFCIYVHQWYWPVIFFFVWYLCLVLISEWWWPHKMDWEVFLPLWLFGNSLRRIGVNSSLHKKSQVLDFCLLQGF